VIQGLPGNGGVRLDGGGLPAGAVAYLDAEWASPDANVPLPAVVAHQNRVSWGDGTAAALPEGVTGEAAAGAMLASVAREAADCVRGVPPQSVRVHGRGLVAALVRQLVAANSSIGAPEGLHAVIDTTGRPDVLLAATRELANGGLLVLAGEPLGRHLTIDLYPDIHRRGLQLVGVAPPRTATAELDLAEPLVVPPAVEARPDAPVSGDAWYFVRA
jgi:hypothetical protein